MRVDGYDIPEELLYTSDHEWVRLVDDSRAVVGITDYAAKELHDVVFVELPTVGREIKQMSVFGVVESTKTVSDLYSPFSGKVVKTNKELDTRPELVNQSAYEEGWLIEISPFNLHVERKTLLTPEEYASHLQDLLKKKSRPSQ